MKNFDGNKLFVIVRHGDYNGSGELSISGRNQISTMAKVLERHIKNPIIFTSPQRRAIETSQILAAVFDARYEVEGSLDCENPEIKEIIKLLDTINSSILLVTHQPVMEDLVEILSGKTLIPSTGTAVIINPLEGKTIYVKGDLEKVL